MGYVGKAAMWKQTVKRKIKKDLNSKKYSSFSRKKTQLNQDKIKLLHKKELEKKLIILTLGHDIQQ